MSFIKKCIFFSLLLWINISEAKIIASGVYESQDTQQAVLMTAQENNMWRAIAPWAQDTNILSSGLLQVHCASSNVCVATGWIEDRRDLNETGVILSSHDAGNHWMVINPFMTMPNFKTAYLPGVKCHDNKCIVVGEYTTHLQDKSQAIIFTSTDKGISWLTENPLKDSANLIAAECTDAFCLAVGNRHSEAIILKKANKDKSWISKKIPDASLHDVSCNKNACVALGLNTLLVSYDKGDSWQEDLRDQGTSFYSVHCESTMCFVVGQMNTSDKSKSVVLTLNNNDKNWKMTPFFSNNNNLNVSIFSPIHCNKNFCATVGSYRNAEKTAGIILLSYDKGDHWQSIFPYANMTDIKYSFLTRIACEQNTCTAVGDFFGPAPDGSFKNQAAIWSSDEKGEVWQYNPILSDKDYANLDSVSST